MRTLGRMRGRSTHPTEQERESGGATAGNGSVFLQGKVGYRIAPSSVTFGDSFPPRGSLWVVQPHTKKRPKSGHADGPRNSPTTGTMCHNRQNERAAASGPSKKGGRGATPRDSLRPGFLLEKAWIPRPGPGGEPTSQVPTCDGLNRTTCRRQTRPPAPPAGPRDAGPNQTTYRPPPKKSPLPLDKATVLWL